MKVRGYHIILLMFSIAIFLAVIKIPMYIAEMIAGFLWTTAPIFAVGLVILDNRNKGG